MTTMSQADRERAIPGGYIKSYLNSGHNVTSAEDIKNAILFKGSVCASVSIIDIDIFAMRMTPIKIYNIQSL